MARRIRKPAVPVFLSMEAYADPESALDRAFERLYRRYVKDVYRYTLALLRNPSDAEDVTQTTFLNAYRAFKRGEEPRKPQHWLIKIAHNACRSRYVQTARRPTEVPLVEGLAQIRVPTEDAMDVRDLLTALGALPFNQRAAIVMRELDGRSYRDIAETLGVTVPAVETLIFRARRRLRAQRAALQALGAVQLPPSLATFFEGGGAIASGGALLGSGLALKAALMLVAGVLAGGVGYKTVNATAFPSRPAGHPTALSESRHLATLAAARAPTAAPASPRQAKAASGAARSTELVARTSGASGRGASLPAGVRHLGTLAAPGQAQSEAGGGSPAVASASPAAPAPAGTTSGSARPSTPPAPVNGVAKPISHPAAPALPVAVPNVTAAPAVPEPVAAVVPPAPPLPKVP